MKYIYAILLSLFVNMSYAQQFNYEARWKAIEVQEERGNLKSLRTDVQAIYAQAQKDGQMQQRIKALLYLSRIKWTTNDDDVSEDKAPFLEVFNDFRRETAAAKGVEKLILQDYLAQMYTNYAQSSTFKRSKIKTVSEADENDDLRTWDNARFDREITALHEANQQQKTVLQHARTNDYATLLTTSDEDHVKPTLYDVLTDDYISYLINNSNLHQEKDEKVGEDKVAALRQSLIDLHRADADPTAFLWNETARLNTLYKDKPEQRSTALEQLADAHLQCPYTAEVLRQAAEALRQYGSYKSRYDINNPTDYVKMYAIYRKAVDRVPGSQWTNACRSAITVLEEKSVKGNVPAQCAPEQPIPLWIAHQNTSKVSIALYKMAEENPSYKNRQKLYEKNIELKTFTDYKTHATYYKLDGLPKGNYQLDVSVNEADDDKNELLNTTSISFCVGNVAYLMHLTKDKNVHLQFVNPQTGEAVRNQAVELYAKREKKDPSGKLSYPYIQVATGKTNAQGLYQLAVSEEDKFGEYQFKFPALQEMCAISLNDYNSMSIENEEYDKDDEKTSKKLKIFTDRAIYRPGQIVHFKGLLTEYDGLHTRILPRQSILVKLTDDNGKEVSSLALTSNDFGSVAGEFVLPASKTGNFDLRGDNNFYGSRFIRVEEYKRPKFEVAFTPLQGEYKLGQDIEVNGTATAFSGSKISDAKVVYRVVREEVWLWRSYYDYFFWPRLQSNSATIAQGETQTDADGVFKINFNAEPYAERQAGRYRSYQYKITADVTDVNGETQSQTYTATVGDLPKTLTLDTPNMLFADDFKTVKITSKNLNGVDAPSRGTLRITQMLPPTTERVLLPNRQQSTDYQLLGYEEFVRSFPHLAYSIDDDQYTRKGAVVFESQFNTEKSNLITLGKTLPNGIYLVEASTLLGADTIQTCQTVKVYDRATLACTHNVFFAVHTDKIDYAVGEKATVCFTTDLKEGFVYVRTERNKTLGDVQEVRIHNGMGKLTFVPTINDVKNGIFLQTVFFHSGDYEQQNATVKVVERKDTQLDISTQTFRSKLTPGGKETWRFTVSGKDKDKALAEVVAAMYDASLDKFSENSFDFQPSTPNPYSRYVNNYYFRYFRKNLYKFVNTSTFNFVWNQHSYLDTYNVHVPGFNWFGFEPTEYSRTRYAMKAESKDMFDTGVSDEIMPNRALNKNASLTKNLLTKKTEQATPPLDLSQVKVRTNLQETAFFYPQINTEANGDFTLTFTSPEALTQWKLLLFAHTKDMKFGTQTLYTQTQKELMVAPNAPRFLREGDEVTISSKISNLSEKSLDGGAQLLLFDALTGKSVDADFANTNSQKPFNVEAGRNTSVAWTLRVPQTVQAVTYRVVAKAGKFSDGEENALPVLTNRTLVTETLPISIKEGQDKTFTFETLQNNTSNTLQNFSLTMEMTTNPTWLAVMSLPYLREYPYECSEQIFSRLYGNMLSFHILNSSPKIKKVFDDWQNKGVLKSELVNNTELKNILLEETPWLYDAESESDQMARLALFFDLNTMSNELAKTQEKFLKKQNADGGFPWFDGGHSNPYISQHLIGGFGKLRRMLSDDTNTMLNDDILALIGKSITFADEETIREINEMKKRKQKVDGRDLMHYYYVRSFWLDDYPLPAKTAQYLKDINRNVTDYYTKYDLQREALAATVLQRYGYTTAARSIINHLKETSVESDEMGMYWKANVPGWWWYQAPVETQAALIEAFAEITPTDTKAIEEMKVWLLKNRQSNAWSTTKATTEAVYALLAFGKDWTNAEEGVSVSVGKQQVYPSQNPTTEQRAGYIKQVWHGEEITPDMGSVHVQKTSPGVAWGGLYWQYFEDLDKISAASSDVKMEKQIFIKRNTDKGIVLMPFEAAKVGDLISVRLTIHTDRDMEFVHIKDMRAAGFEPVNTLSDYKWQNGVGYYENTRDAATNFFIDYLPKGVYVFEYDLRANNAGTFSNGITTLQNMYAPEMSAHSKGVRVKIGEK